MRLYFGNAVTTVTTIMILALLGFIGVSVWNHSNINYWGRRSLILLAYGLVVCCFAAARDGLDKTIQNAVDGSCAPGVFPLISIPNLIGCIGAAVIIIAAIATPIAKSQQMRQIWL
jgi:fucose 4-O-acetylase-like acetyltransferase